MSVAWCHSCAVHVRAVTTEHGELECDECHGTFVERPEDDEEDETGLGEFLGVPEREDAVNAAITGGVMQQILAQVLGGVGLPDGDGGPSLAAMLAGGAGGPGLAGGDLLGGLPPALALAPLFAGSSGNGLGGNGLGSTMGDYAVGNLSNIIEQLMANDAASHRTSVPASKRAVERLCSNVVVREEHVAEGWECAIHKEAFRCGDLATQLPCGHTFQQEAIATWLREHHSCPVCRFELPTDEEEAAQQHITRHAPQDATAPHAPAAAQDTPPAPLVAVVAADDDARSGPSSPSS